MRHALVTGGAGFVGSHLVDRLLAEGWQVTVIDNFDPFYDPALKRANIAKHTDFTSYELLHIDIRDLDGMRSRLSSDYDVIVHFAAKAGVRASLAHPAVYEEVNIRGTQNLLELARERRIGQFIFISSSSVYGINPRVPWKENDSLLPVSPYGATKAAGEILGHVYSRLYGIRFIALRLFTVYGPRQRPDLAIHKFARKMLNGEKIPIYGDGSASRDYTYVEDVINGVRAAMDYRDSDYEVINLGNNRRVSLLEMVRTLEAVLGCKAELDFQPLQPGDVPHTWADVTKAEKLLGYRPLTPFSEGIKRFVAWLIEQDVLRKVAP